MTRRWFCIQSMSARRSPCRSCGLITSSTNTMPGLRGSVKPPDSPWIRFSFPLCRQTPSTATHGRFRALFPSVASISGACARFDVRWPPFSGPSFRLVPAPPDRLGLDLNRHLTCSHIFLPGPPSIALSNGDDVCWTSEMLPARSPSISKSGFDRMGDVCSGSRMVSGHLNRFDRRFSLLASPRWTHSGLTDKPRQTTRRSRRAPKTRRHLSLSGIITLPSPLGYLDTM